MKIVFMIVVKRCLNVWDIKLRHNGERWLIEATTKVKPS